MINQKFFQKLKTQFKEIEKMRLEAQKFSNEALHSAKRAIFAFHRNDWKTGEKLLAHSLDNLKKVTKLTNEGSFKAALEEYAEAELFRQFLYKENLGPVKEVEVNLEIYLGGLTDLVGEILRYAVKQATEKQLNEVKYSQEAVDKIMGQLIEFNFTGYLRTKYDQAKQARRKLEEVVYELSLRR